MGTNLFVNEILIGTLKFIREIVRSPLKMKNLIKLECYKSIRKFYIELVPNNGPIAIRQTRNIFLYLKHKQNTMLNLKI